MNRELFHHPLEPGGLYAPRSRRSSSENIRCADCVGIAGATAGQTTKLLSFAVFFMRRSAVGTGSGGVGRINANKTNTVLLRFVFDPVEYPPVCPRRHSFAKVFAPALLFAALHVVKRFDANRVDGVPRRQNFAVSFDFAVRDFDPQDNTSFAQGAALNEFSGRLIKPLIENGGSLRLFAACAPWRIEA